MFHRFLFCWWLALGLCAPLAAADDLRDLQGIWVFDGRPYRHPETLEIRESTAEIRYANFLGSFPSFPAHSQRFTLNSTTQPKTLEMDADDAASGFLKRYESVLTGPLPSPMKRSQPKRIYRLQKDELWMAVDSPEGRDALQYGKAGTAKLFRRVTAEAAAAQQPLAGFWQGPVICEGRKYHQVALFIQSGWVMGVLSANEKRRVLDSADREESHYFFHGSLTVGPKAKPQSIKINGFTAVAVPESDVANPAAFELFGVFEQEENKLKLAVVVAPHPSTTEGIPTSVDPPREAPPEPVKLTSIPYYIHLERAKPEQIQEWLTAHAIPTRRYTLEMNVLKRVPLKVENLMGRWKLKSRRDMKFTFTAGAVTGENGRLVDFVDDYRFTPVEKPIAETWTIHKGHIEIAVEGNKQLETYGWHFNLQLGSERQRLTLFSPPQPNPPENGLTKRREITILAFDAETLTLTATPKRQPWIGSPKVENLAEHYEPGMLERLYVLERIKP